LFVLARASSCLCVLEPAGHCPTAPHWPAASIHRLPRIAPRRPGLDCFASIGNGIACSCLPATPPALPRLPRNDLPQHCVHRLALPAAALPRLPCILLPQFCFPLRGLASRSPDFLTLSYRIHCTDSQHRPPLLTLTWQQLHRFPALPPALSRLPRIPAQRPCLPLSRCRVASLCPDCLVLICRSIAPTGWHCPCQHCPNCLASPRGIHVATLSGRSFAIIAPIALIGLPRHCHCCFSQSGHLFQIGHPTTIPIGSHAAKTLHVFVSEIARRLAVVCRSVATYDLLDCLYSCGCEWEHCGL
jgi:hypothetical protein